MANPRKIVFRNDSIYHICNRAVDGRSIFRSKREYERGLMLLRFYKYAKTPMRLSYLLNLSHENQLEVLSRLENSERLVSILSYAFMPNHFHVLLKQLTDNGISKFVSNISNSYSRYSNVKSKRIGPVFQGRFRAVFIQSNEQLAHVSRYIHLNPVTASIIDFQALANYEFTSYIDYVNGNSRGMVDTEDVLSLFNSAEDYEEFVTDHIGYSKTLHEIEYLTLEYEV